MKYYSTNGNAPLASLEKAVVRGLAEDRGLYMPQRIKRLPDEFFADMASMSFHDVAYNVASAFFGEDIDLDVLQDLVRDTLSFPVPLVRVSDSIYSLELFHGPTLAFKDVFGNRIGICGVNKRSTPTTLSGNADGRNITVLCVRYD